MGLEFASFHLDRSPGSSGTGGLSPTEEVDLHLTPLPRAGISPTVLDVRVSNDCGVGM